MTSPSLEPGRAPRAVTYARANSGVDRYRHPARRRVVRAPAGPVQRRGLRMNNRRRFWFFTAVLAAAFILGAATLNAVLAGPAHLAQEPRTPPAERGRGPLTAPQPGVEQEEQEQGPGPVRPERPPPTSGAPGDGPVPTGASPQPGSAGGPGADGAAGADSGHSGPGAGPAGGSGPAGGPGGRPAAPTPEPEEPTEPADEVQYGNCGQARRAGAAPLFRGDPGYSAKLDRDGDGVACD